MAANSDKEKYINELRKKINDRAKNQRINTEATKIKHDEEYDAQIKKLDSNVKKTTNYIKRLKNITEQQKDQLLKDFGNLNLSKYVEEMASSIFESKLKMTDVPVALMICYEAHKRYPTFSSHLYTQLQKILSASSNIISQGDETVQQTNLSKFRVDLRLAGELIASNMFMREDTKSKGFNMIYSMFKHIIEVDKEKFLYLNIIISFCKHFSEEYIGLYDENAIQMTMDLNPKTSFPRFNTFSPTEITAFRSLIYEGYFKTHLINRLKRDFEEFFKLNGTNRYIFRNKGELHPERVEKYHEIENAFNKLLNAAKALCLALHDNSKKCFPTFKLIPYDSMDDDDSLPNDMKWLLDEIAEKSAATHTSADSAQQDNKDGVDDESAASAGATPFSSLAWRDEDEDTQKFYCDLPDLKTLIPVVGGGLGTTGAKAPLLHQTTLPEDKSAAASVDSNFIKGTERKSKPHYDETTSTKCGAATASQKGKQQQRKRADEMSETTTTIMTTAGGVSSSCSKNPPHHTAVVIVSKSAEFDKFFDDNKKDDEEENGGHTGNHLLLDHDDNHNQVDKDDIQNHVAEEGITTVTAVISSAADTSSIPPSSATTTTTTTVPPTNYYIDDDAEDTLSSLSTLGLNSDLDELDFDDGGGGLSSGGGAESTKKYLKNKTTQANEKIKKKRHNNSNNKFHRAGPGNNMTTASSSALGSAASNSSGPNNSINVFMKLKMDAFLEALPTRINRDLIDEAAINFLTHLNNKINRKRLIGHLLSVPRNRTDLLPFYSRFVALVTQCIPEFGKKDLSKKLYSSFRCQLRKKDQINLEVKLKIVRFLSELTKFSIFPPMDMCYCLFLLINDFKYHSIEMACAILENCGRFLVKTPETKRRAKFLLENLKRKKNATLLDERFSTLIENAYYTCLPDDDPLATALGAKQLSERAYELTLTPWQRYMRYLLYDAFNRKTFTLDKLVKVLRKFHWDNNHDFSLDNNNNDSSTAAADLDTKNQLDDNLDVTVSVTPEEDDNNNNNSSNSVTPTTQTVQQQLSSSNNNFNTAVSADPKNGVDSKDLDDSEDHSASTLIIIRNLSDTEEFFVRLILNLSKFRFDDLPDLANVVSSLSVYRGDTIGIAVVDDLLELIRDSLTMLKFETKYSYHYQNEGVINMNNYNNSNSKRFKVEVNSQQSVLSAVKLIGEFYNYRLLDTPILFRFLFGLISFTSTLIMDDTDTEEGVNHDNNNYNPCNNFEPPNYLFSIRLVLVLLETCASYFDRGSFKKKLDIFLTYFQRYYLEKYEWIGWKIENPQEGESDTIFPIDIQNYYREVLDQLRPKGKLYTSLKEVQEAIRLIEEDYLMQLQKSFSPHPSDAAGPLYPHHDDKGGNYLNDIESLESNTNNLDDQLSPNFQGGLTASTEPGNVADITTPLVTTTTAITPNASGDSFNFYEDAKYDFVLPSGDEDEITPNATESIKSGETGGVTDREQKPTSYNTLSPKIKKCEEDEEFVKSFDTLVSESLLQRAHETVKLQNLDINLPPNIRSKASKLSSKLIKSITNEDEGGGISTDDSQNQPGTGTNTARVMDFVLVCKKGNKPQYKDIKIPFDTKLAHRLKSLEEAERKEKEQMKKLTLNINRLQEEEEQKNQILELQQKSTFPIYAKETSQHQVNYHPGPGGGPYQRYYHKSANKLQSNQGNNQQIYHGGKL